MELHDEGRFVFRRFRGARIAVFLVHGLTELAVNYIENCCSYNTTLDLTLKPGSTRLAPNTRASPVHLN